MLYLKCTNNILKLLDLRKEQLTEFQTSEAPLGNWYIQQFSMDGYRFYIFMSERTFLSFVLFEGHQKMSIETLPIMFMGGLQQVLQLLDIPQPTINDTLSHYNSGLYSKTDSRTDLGVLNHLIQHYLWCIEDVGGFRDCHLSDIIFKVNCTRQRRLNWQTPLASTKQQLGIKLS
ncbi:MAG TPA: hypothetical protein PLW01_03040 [Agitococcus sp.]|nr:hypothetical protein [Agitococcus sp.]